jgi:hypothetical protein
MDHFHGRPGMTGGPLHLLLDRLYQSFSTPFVPTYNHLLTIRFIYKNIIILL